MDNIEIQMRDLEKKSNSVNFIFWKVTEYIKIEILTNESLIYIFQGFTLIF